VADVLYYGERPSRGARVYRADGLKTVPLDPRTDLRNHSPTGLEWGYRGSGPSQLALALLADATGDARRALTSYNRFMELVTARLTKERWCLTRESVLLTLESIESEERVNTSDLPQAPPEGGNP